MKWTDDDLDRALRELGAEDPPPAVLAAVRSGVLGRIRRPRWWMWTWAPVAAAALAILLWPRPAEIAPPPLIATTPAVPAAAWVKTERRPAPLSPRRLAPPERQTEFIRIFTDDPDVVILWSLETKGDAE